MSKAPSSVKHFRQHLALRHSFLKSSAELSSNFRHTEVLWFALGPQAKQVAPLLEGEPEARSAAGFASSSLSASAFSASTSHPEFSSCCRHTKLEWGDWVRRAVVAPLLQVVMMPGPLCWFEKT